MLRANFFKFFKYKNYTSGEIVQYNSNKNFSIQDQIKTNIIEIDQKILDINLIIVFGIVLIKLILKSQIIDF